MAEMKANISDINSDFDKKLKEMLNENLWKTLVGTGILLSLFKCFS